MITSLQSGEQLTMEDSNSVVFEIKQYMVIWRQLELRDFDGIEVKVRGMVRCSGDEYSLDVIFVTEDSDYPEPIFDVAGKKGFMFLPRADMLAFVDILRNEKPIFGHLRGDRPEWTSVTTSQEPVGEGEISS
jgi:hypothetical protein